MPSAVLLVMQVVSSLDGIRDGAPFCWAQGDQAHFGLEIGLVEAWEHAEGVECLELRVEVLLLVRAVREGVQTNAILIVRCQVAHLNSVPALSQVGNFERDDLVLE